MAGQIPQFLTGAQATIQLTGTTENTILAYCTDVSYNVSVQHIPVEALGQFEVYSNEPVSYSVNGSFSVIRYKLDAAVAGGPAGTSTDAAETDIGKQLTPSQMLGSATFDLAIHLGFSTGETSDNDKVMIKILDCRITNRSQQLNKRSLMTDTFQFVAIGMDAASVIELDANSKTIPALPVDPA